MVSNDHVSVNAHNHLTIGGKDTLELAREFGTPLYVMDEAFVRAACRHYVAAIKTHYDGKGLAAFASKAFCCKAMCKIAAEEGLALDVVSKGELFTALLAGFPADRMLFHGNNKPADELEFAITSGIGRIVADNINELEQINTIAGSCGKRQSVQLRITPGVEAHTHDYVRTGQTDSKFGFALQTGDAMRAVQMAVRMPNLRLSGVHCHIGSQILDVQPFMLAAEIMTGFIADARDQHNITIEELNLGGGFGIRYTEQDNPPPHEDFLHSVSRAISGVCSARNLPLPFIYIEPGRSIVAPAGITLYTVGAIKEIPGIRTYLSVDGGMADNPRYALYGSQYEMLIANKAGAEKTKRYTVAGRCCESGDLLGKDVPLQDAAAGDILAVLATGAYNYSMASNYNRLLKPAVVFVNNGAVRVAVKRQSYEDLIQSDE
ncbi:MAG: diaminopimelate decarboxylase [Treponema sp.]|nr:diaminopimelate decarboxylase [Treponema sp.]